MRAAPSILSAVVLLVACSDTTGPSDRTPDLVRPRAPEGITFRVAPAAATLQAGQSRQFTITYAGDAALSAAAVGAAWQSSNESVATVSPRGLVRGISGGQATITASWGGYQASALVTVNGPMKKHDGAPVCLTSDHGAGESLKPQC
jgi:hypothetical protein